MVSVGSNRTPSLVSAIIDALLGRFDEATVPESPRVERSCSNSAI